MKAVLGGGFPGPWRGPRPVVETAIRKTIGHFRREERPGRGGALLMSCGRDDLASTGSRKGLCPPDPLPI